jgi:Toprim-like
MSAPDVRAFYKELGIQLPGWPKLEAPIRCFAQPDAHNHADCSPSCSVNLASGAWNCHGCGAHGGAYDAALAVGHTPRAAIDLMIAHGLAEARAHHAQHSKAKPPAPPIRPLPAAADRPRLAVDEADVQSWADALGADSRLARRLILERAWGPRTMRALQIGSDGARLTIPIRNKHGHLRGVLRYDAFGRRQPKMRAAAGSRLGLIPHPGCEPSDHVILVEGPPDMIAARSAGLPAVAIPGTNAWHPAWASMLAARRVTIVMDCDAPGRRAADEIASSLTPFAARTEVIDLWPDRNDGYDLTDRILEWRLVKRGRPHALGTARLLLEPIRPARSPEVGTSTPGFKEDPYERKQRQRIR